MMRKPLTAEDLVARLKAAVPEIDVRELPRDGIVLFDIRDPADAAEGTAPGARLLSQRFIEFEVPALGLAIDQPIAVMCYGGRTSLVAARALLEMGYTDVRSVRGGFTAWKEAGLPVERPPMLSAAERQRYSRHLALPDVGLQGQLKLKAARVAIVGAGGLGSPVALYLAAAGVGYVRLIDDDVVEDSNLQRQVIHGTGTLGQPKVESARQRMLEINPFIEVEARQAALTVETARTLLEGVDIVVDGSDNFDTRYAVNRATVEARQTLVSASVFRFSGQLSAFAPHLGHPCYTCLYPERTPNDVAPSCSGAGVLGALAGTLGLMQAMETLKLILGIGQAPFGRLVLYDGLKNTLRHLSFKRNPQCLDCGPRRRPLEQLAAGAGAACALEAM